MSVATYTKSGTKATTNVTLDKNVFGVDVKDHNLIKQVYVAYLANGRENHAVTLKRGEVSGGGKKPWKQKGTGRARFGSSRVPIWRGGGITFGPTGNENYSVKVHTKAKRLAIRQSLSMASKDNKVKVIESFILKDGKTKELSQLLKKLDANRQTLLVVANLDEKLNNATQNLQEVKVVQAMYLNVYDIVNSYNIIIAKDSLEIISKWLGDVKATTKSSAERKVAKPASIKSKSTSKKEVKK